MKNNFILMTLLMLLALPIKAEDIKIGAGVGANNLMDFNIQLGLYSFPEDDKFTLGASFNIYATNVNEIIYAVKNNQNIDQNNLATILNPIINEKSKYGALALITMQYDIFDYRGLYFFGGVGYGFDASGRKDVDSVIVVLDQINKLDINDKDAINNLSQDQDFINALTKVGQSDILANFINNLLPNSQDLIDMVNTPDKINNLVNNKDELNNFLNVTTDRYNQAYPNGFQLQSASQGSNLVCDTLVLCKQGVAYQFGVGYDLKLIGGLGLDLYTKIQGVLQAPPTYVSGANIIYKF